VRRRDPSKPPRVLLIVQNLPLPGDRRVWLECQALKRAGYEVAAISPAGPGDPRETTLDGVRLYHYPPAPATGSVGSFVYEFAYSWLQTLRLALRDYRRNRFDVIQACNPPDLFFLIVWPFKLLGKRFIFDQHDLTPELYSSLYMRDRGLIMRVLRWSEHRTYRLADVVLSCNESYRRLALTRGGKTPDRVFVVRNGPGENWPIPVAPDPSLKDGRPYLVVYMGIMGFQDGVDVLVEAVHELVHTLGFHEVTFAIVGDGSAMASLKQQARELDVEEWVTFVGWVRDEETMALYLASADACVCPEPSSPLNDQSTFAKVMEYMAAGKPIVAFDLPETRFSAREAAAYAAPGDVAGFARLIRDVLTDATLKRKMTEAAAARIPSLRWERQIPALLAAYDSALDAERRG